MLRCGIATARLLGSCTRHRRPRPSDSIGFQSSPLLPVPEKQPSCHGVAVWRTSRSAPAAKEVARGPVSWLNPGERERGSAIQGGR